MQRQVLTQHRVPTQLSPALEILHIIPHPPRTYSKSTSQRAKTRRVVRVRLFLTSQPRSSDRQIRITPNTNRVRTITAHPCPHASLVWRAVYGVHGAVVVVRRSISAGLYR